MRKALLVSAALCLMAFNNSPVADLAWLDGRWSMHERGGFWAEQFWLDRGGILLGANNEGAGEISHRFEFMRIDMEGEGRIILWVSPQGGEPIPFALISKGPNQAIFENRGHDPMRISYRREGNILIVESRNPNGGHPMIRRYSRR